MTPDEFLEWIKPAAYEICGRYGLPAACCIAQAALESGWGKHAIGEYNLFGRKWGGWGRYIEVETQEDDGTGNLYTIVDKFQDYDSLEHAISDWCELMLWGPYLPYSEQYKADGDLVMFVRGISHVYATSIYYSEKIMSTIYACELA